jgi:hypothetical protein
MTDGFDDFLAARLSPPEREPDRAFVARVQARILVDEAMRAQRAGILSQLSQEILAVVAVAAAFLLLSRSPSAAAFLAESPALVLLALIGLFSLLIGLFALRRSPAPVASARLSRT